MRRPLDLCLVDGIARRSDRGRLRRERNHRGFTITGGRNGIAVLRGGSAVIDNNTIEVNADVGIIVTKPRRPASDSSNVAARGAPNVIRNNHSYAVTPAGTLKGSKRVSRSDATSTDGLR